MTAAEYEAQITRELLGDYAVKDCWVGNWLVRAVRRGTPERVTFIADHTVGVGATAKTPEGIAVRMAAWDQAYAAMVRPVAA